MLTWLPTWKAKSLYHVGTFLPKRFFLPLQKFKTIKIKLEKNPSTQKNRCLLHISRTFKDVFEYICFIIYLSQTLSNWESAIIFIDCHSLPLFTKRLINLVIVLMSIKCYFVLTMFLAQFNFPEDTSLRIGHKVTKTCSCETFFHKNML